MRILVFGKNGQVARSLIDAAGAGSITTLGSNECDLRIAGAGAGAIQDASPNIVINAAAYTAVDAAETDRNAALRLNADAPTELAIAANKTGARFIHLSTDYVFDGASHERTADAYAEDAATAPLNVYGETKRAGEMAILNATPDAIIIRTSWIFSSYGSNFVKTMLRAGAENKALNIVDDQMGGPTPADEIARAILAIAAKIHRGAPGYGVYHYQGSPIVSWAEFAAEIFRIADMDAQVCPVPSSEYPTAARRPRRTALDCRRIERDFGISAPDWRAGLRRIIDALRQAQPPA